MNSSDFEQFGRIILSLAKMSYNRLNNPPDKDEIKLMFGFLKHLSIEQIIINAGIHFRKKNHFPGMADLNGTNEDILETDGIIAYEIIEKLILANYHPDWSERNKKIVEQLEKINRLDLKKYVYNWAWDIANTDAPAVIRSQFIKSFKANLIENQKDLITKQLQSENNKKLIK